MPKPVVIHGSAALSTLSTTLTGRAGQNACWKSSQFAVISIAPQLPMNPARSVRRCCCHPRRFSHLTPKPLARLHEPNRRDLDEVFFSRVSTPTSVPSDTLSPFGNNNARRKNGEVFSSGFPSSPEMGGSDHKPPDERVLKLGKTLRKLSPLLPSILINALPSDLLSPQITLHLFPSTHPHLPTVKGRVLYRAALWTVPVAWSSLPLLGNVKLQILSERMVRADSVLGCEHSADCGEERLVVRWKTEPRGEGGSSTNNYNSNNGSITSSSLHSNNYKNNTSRITDTDKTNKNLSTLLGGGRPIFSPGKEGRFEGLFIFAFDNQGRIAGHTIEHADQADGWDRTAKFVTLTDWLLGKARGTLVDQGPQPALAAAHDLPRYRHDYLHYQQKIASERHAASLGRPVGARE